MGPLELMVIGLEDAPAADEILPTLAGIQERGCIRLVDLLFVTKDAAATVTIHAPRDEHRKAYGDLAGDLAGLLTVDAIDALVAGLPATTSAAIVLLEHLWVTDLMDAVTQGRSRREAETIEGRALGQAPDLRYDRACLLPPFPPCTSCAWAGAALAS